MFDIYMTRLHELTVVLYAFSVLLYFFDFIHHNRKANRIAFWLLAFVWVLQTIFLCFYMVKTGRFPVLTIFEGLYFYAWVLVTLITWNQSFIKSGFYRIFYKYTWLYCHGDSYLCPDAISIPISWPSSLYLNCC